MKQCHRCGVDVSASRRFKDAKGRYLCGPCNDAVLETVAAQGREAGGGSEPRPVGPGSDGVVGGVGGVPSRNADGGSGSDGGDDGYGIVLDESVYAAGEAAGRRCPACAQNLSPEAVVCVHCGFHTKDGVTVQAAPKKKEKKTSTPKCRHCGYDIRGLNTLTCPECGGKISLSRRDRDADDSRAVMRKAYLRPVILSAIGITAMCGIFVATGTPLVTIVAYLISLPVLTVFATLAFFLCCMLWMGFDAPMHLSALRLLSVIALLGPISSVFEFLPGFVWLMLTLATAVGLLVKELELDLPDAVFFGLAMGLMQIAGVFALVAAIKAIF